MVHPPQRIAKMLATALQCHQAGDLHQAERLYRQILTHQPDQSDTLHYLGLLAHQVGRHDAAADLISKAIRQDTRNPYFYNNLGEAYRALGKSDAAMESYRRALRLQPDMIEANGNLGLLLQEGGKPEEAVKYYRRVLAVQPDSMQALNNLGTVHQERREYAQALPYFERILELDPRHADAHNNIAVILQSLDQDERALLHYEQALWINPGYADARMNLAYALRKMGRLDESERHYRRVLAENPEHPRVFFNLGALCLRQGRLEESIDALRRAIAIKPDYLDASRSLLAALLYLPGLDEGSRYEAHRQFAQRHSVECAGPNASHKHGSPEKKIRVGYVSSDFRDHPVGRNLGPVMAHHDRGRFEVYLYGNVNKPDAVTERFKQNASGWRSIIGLSDEAAARLIREDKIDILVLLAGRFDDNRPLIAAYRAAPVQVSMHDPATSGLDEMDYLIADAHLVPRDTAERFTERIVRLPTFYIHAPLMDMPDVSTLPAGEKGFITFGSFNNPSKVNARVIALWSAVLHAVPGSKLLLKYHIYGVASVKARYLERFAHHGIAADRLIFEGGIDALSRHLSRYAEIDIALDPFPFTGSTTTFEALWMGVPVVTLGGDHMVACWSAAMLEKIKLPELIAHDEAGYVQIARRLATDIDQLSALRAGLRERLAQSPLCAQRRRTKQLERLYRWMWRKWCADRG